MPEKINLMKTFKMLYVLMAILFAGAMGTNVSGQMQGMKMDKPDAGIQGAICVLYPTQGSTVSGTVTFTKTEGGIKVVADLQGFQGAGKHGFHIHEYGDCSAPDGTSAGGHYNPAMMSHGAPTDKTRHEGDMGNIEADASGKAHLEYVDPMLTFTGPNSIIGRSIIVHKNEDDMKTQPTGNAGPRVACGVIGVAK
jgi:superoxide dismutase, Cu-Zn family